MCTVCGDSGWIFIFFESQNWEKKLWPFLHKSYYVKDHCRLFEPLWNGVNIFSVRVLFLACLNYLDQFFVAESDSYPCDCNLGYRWCQTEIEIV